MLTTMFHMAWSAVEEEDEDYQARVEVRKLHSDIEPFPDIKPFGPSAVGALKKLNDWLHDVEDWLAAHEKGDFLEQDHGKPLRYVPPSQLRVKQEMNEEQESLADSKDDSKGKSSQGKEFMASADGEEGQKSPTKESAGAQSFYEQRRVSEPLTRTEKKMMRISDRHMANYKASQATFYAAIKRSVKNNSDVLREVMGIRKCDDRGSKAILAIKAYIMQSNDPGSIKEDSDKYFTSAAESFSLKYPLGQIEPITCDPKDVNDHLSRFLFDLETHVDDYRSLFDGFPAKFWTKFKPEQNLIGIIRDVLPETPEWRSVRMQIMQGTEWGDDFDKAIGRVRVFIKEFTPRQAKLAIHQTAAQSNSSNSSAQITANPGVPQSEKTEAEKKAANDRAAIDPDAECFSCGAKGHKSNWWGCPKYEENKKKRAAERREKFKKKKDGEGGGHDHDSGGGGKGGYDHSQMRCFKCLEWGHIAENCPNAPKQPQQPTYANAAPAETAGALYYSHGAGAGYAPHGRHEERQFIPAAQRVPALYQPSPHTHFQGYAQQPQYQQQHQHHGHMQHAATQQPMQQQAQPEVRQASVHMQQSGPMQALQHNLQLERGNAPPSGVWNRGYGRGPNVS